MTTVKQTITAALGRRDREADMAQVETDEDAQEMASQSLRRKADREGREAGEAVGTA